MSDEDHAEDTDFAIEEFFSSPNKKRKNALKEANEAEEVARGRGSPAPEPTDQEETPPKDDQVSPFFRSDPKDFLL